MAQTQSGIQTLIDSDIPISWQNEISSQVFQTILTALNEATFQGPSVYTYTTLPVGVAGLLVNISDSTVNTWGASITVGSGTHNVLARYNGTNWTVVGI